MSATIIDELMITLGIDGSKAKKGMAEATDAISGGVSKITSMLGGLTAAFAGVYSVTSAFSEYLSAADSMGKFSDALGVNIEEMHAWSEAAARSGGSIEGFQGSVKSLTTQLSKMATMGKSKAGNVLAAVGIDPGEVGRQRDAFQVMEEIADKMQTMSKAEAMGFGASLGLDSGTIMLLQQGRDGVRDLVQHQKELGVYTKEDARVTGEFNDAIDDTKQAFMALAASVFRGIVPALKTVVDWMTKLVVFLRENQTTVKIFFTLLAGLITALLIPAIGRLFAALLTNPITWIIAALILLAIALEDLWGWMNGKESEWGETWAAIFGNPEDAKKKFDEYLTMFWEFTDKAAETLRSLGNTIGENSGFAMIGAGLLVFAGLVRTVLIPAGSAIIKVFTSIAGVLKIFGSAVLGIAKIFVRAAALMLANPIAAVIMLIIAVLMDLYKWVTTGESMFEDLWRAMFGDPENFKRIMSDVCKFFEDIWNGAIKWINDKWEWLKSSVIGILGAVKGAISDFASFIMSAIGGAIDWAVGKWQAFKAMITGESAFINHDLTNRYVSSAIGGAGNTTNTNTTVSVGEINVHGVQDGRKFGWDTVYGLNAAQNNVGSY